MKKIAVIALLAIFAIKKLSAQTFQNQINGTTAQTKDFSDIKGSPFSSDSWVKGIVTLSNKKVYSNLDVKYSEYEDKLFLKGKNNELMDFNDKVEDFTLKFTKSDNQELVHYRNGYSNIAGTSTEAFFQILVDGKVQLLKKTSKKVQVQNEYGSITSNKSFTATTKFYIVTAEKATLIKKDKKSILSALVDKQSELETYAKTNNLDFKNDEDLVKLINFYNTIN